MLRELSGRLKQEKLRLHDDKSVLAFGAEAVRDERMKAV